MDSNVTRIFPANDFAVVAKESAKEISCGIVIGYNNKGELTIFVGGMIDYRQPVCRDWLWMIESFKQSLINGDYS